MLLLLIAASGAIPWVLALAGQATPPAGAGLGAAVTIGALALLIGESRCTGGGSGV